MKRLPIIYGLFAALFLGSEDILFCSDKNAVGFDRAKNSRVTTYTEENFTLIVDFEKRKVFSELLLFSPALPESQTCVDSSAVRGLYCINRYGGTISINLTTLEYNRASIYIAVDATDDVVIRHGSCISY